MCFINDFTFEFSFIYNKGSNKLNNTETILISFKLFTDKYK